MPADHDDLVRAAERLRTVLRLLHRIAQTNSGAEEPSRSEQAILAWLEQRGPMNISALAAAEHIRPQSASQTVDALERRGWVRRTAHPHDRRQALVELTRPGQDALGIGRELRQAWLVDSLATRFSGEEQRALLVGIELLTRLTEVPGPPPRQPPTSAG